MTAESPAPIGAGLSSSCVLARSTGCYGPLGKTEHVSAFGVLSAPMTLFGR